MAEAAAAWGWQPVDGDPFSSTLTGQVHGLIRTFHGVFRSTTVVNDALVFQKVTYHDVYRGTVGGRAVTVANAWQPVDAVVAGGAHVEGCGVVAVELATFLLLAGIEPRGRHEGIAGPETPTGNPSFDAAYRVVALGTRAEGLVTPEMQDKIAARDDWAFVASETTFAAVCGEPFATADEVSARAGEVVGIVAALPADVARAQVDHSVDDLLVRIAKIDTVEDALAFLQQLSDADRTRLAVSPTPLAKFADVRTPDEAIARLMSMPESERLQVLAMFEKADG
ncbi:MAG TPA: hypothetical protein VGJ03_04135 [Acidimicrobiales bacterium]|jgi:hypothetical protein